MSIEDDFLAEWLKTKSISQGTLTRLAEHLRTRPRAGRPTKAMRDLRALAWHSIATDREGWKSNDAYCQLAKNLNTDERNARRIVSKAIKMNHFCAVWPSTTTDEYVALIFLADIRKMRAASASALFNGEMHVTFPTQKVALGKDFHYFLFAKSTF